MGARASPDRGCLELACWDQNRHIWDGPRYLSDWVLSHLFLKPTRCALKRPAPHGDRAPTQLCRLDATGLKHSYAV